MDMEMMREGKQIPIVIPSYEPDAGTFKKAAGKWFYEYCSDR